MVLLKYRPIVQWNKIETLVNGTAHIRSTNFQQNYWDKTKGKWNIFETNNNEKTGYPNGLKENNVSIITYDNQ